MFTFTSFILYVNQISKIKANQYNKYVSWICFEYESIKMYFVFFSLRFLKFDPWTVYEYDTLKQQICLIFTKFTESLFFSINL